MGKEAMTCAHHGFLPTWTLLILGPKDYYALTNKITNLLKPKKIMANNWGSQVREKFSFFESGGII